MPCLGLGTHGLTGVTCRYVVRRALEAGYRHIDTARMYGNEADVGAGIRESGVAREDIFLTTKLCLDDLSPDGVERQVGESLRQLEIHHVDLVLVHWPSEEIPLERTLEAIERERERGRAKLVGVSNFTPSLVERALEYAPVCCNQVEYHPLLDQSRLLEQAREHGMALTACSPLARGEALRADAVRSIARERDREPAQVVLRWHQQQKGVAAIPRSSDPEHTLANLDVFDFELGDDEMSAISALARGDREV